jgi:predicted DNA-binding transcriptional regulator AlpA
VSDSALTQLLSKILTASPDQQKFIEDLLNGKLVNDGARLAVRNPDEGFIDKRELAKRLGKSLRAVDGYIAKGLVPHYKWCRTIAFKWSEVEAFMRENCRVSRRSGQ